MKTKSTLFLILFVFLIISCKTTKQEKTITEKPIAQIENPLEEINWLKKIKQNFAMNMGMQKQKIEQYSFNNQSVFLINSCVNCADALITVYDKDKNTICQSGGIAGLNTCNDFNKNAKLIKVLYSK
jgi:hypothetical protein